MDVIYKRVAGLDVHKTLVVTVRVIGDGKAERECMTFERDGGAVGPVGLADGGDGAACGDGATGVYWSRCGTS